MQKDANIFDIARMAGVSKSTVSRVLNGHAGVSKATRARVLQAIDECTYIPNNAARNLSSITTQSVVLLVHGIANPFFSRVITLIFEEMRGKNYELILHNCELSDDISITDVAVGIYKEKRPKGMIILGGHFEETYAPLRAMELPIVMVSATIRGITDRLWFSSITIDDEREGERLAGHICQSGHKDIAVIGQSYFRERGMRRVLEDSGVRTHIADLDYDRAYQFKIGYKAAKKMLAQGGFTCFVCLSDVLAIGALRAIHENGLRVPEDISIVGFDGIENSAYTNPPLTTFVQPYEEMAAQSVEILLGIIECTRTHAHIILQTTLDEGASFRPVGS
ncbi:MAG: LacI family transcriptional regulator [Defluviitaleaceae bacterium]|nr:LacI family transcriptional regulator [Defluviitaleaceae bacterium]